MDGIINTIVTDLEETIKKYNLACSLHLCSFKTPTSWAVMSEEGDADCAFSMRNCVKVHSFHISSPNERNKIILALSENGDILQKWMCIYKNGAWTSSCIPVSNFVANDVCNETNCLTCYVCDLLDVEECHLGGTKSGNLRFPETPPL